MRAALNIDVYGHQSAINLPFGSLASSLAKAILPRGYIDYHVDGIGGALGPGAPTERV